jgi:hypothetical protein
VRSIASTVAEQFRPSRVTDPIRLMDGDGRRRRCGNDELHTQPHELPDKFWITAGVVVGDSHVQHKVLARVKAMRSSGLARSPTGLSRMVVAEGTISQ